MMTILKFKKPWEGRKKDQVVEWHSANPDIPVLRKAGIVSIVNPKQQAQSKTTAKVAATAKKANGNKEIGK